MLSRVYTPGHNVVVLLGDYSGRKATIVTQPDSNTLVIADSEDNSMKYITHSLLHQYVTKPEYVLDYDTFHFLLDCLIDKTDRTVVLPGAWDHPSRLTMAGTESLPYKGYSGTLRHVTLTHAFVELPGLSVRNKVFCLTNHCVASVYVPFCVRVNHLFTLTSVTLTTLMGKHVSIPKLPSIPPPPWERTPVPTSEEQNNTEYRKYWRLEKICDSNHLQNGMFFLKSLFTSYMACITGPCQFLFDESLLEGPRGYIQLIGDKQVLLWFSMSYKNGLLHDHLATVDPRRVKPYDGNPMPDYHEVCLTFTDHKSQSCHCNVDICHMYPKPPRAKGQSLLLLCTPHSISSQG